MKRIILSLVLLLLVNLLFAQVPQGILYQAVIRDSNGEVLSEQNIALRISILQSSPSGSTLYSEEHAAQTNTNGLVNLIIGQGSILSGDFSAIPWDNGPFFIKVELDPEGGSNYTEMGTSQLLSVPYALYSGQSGEVAQYNSDTLFVVKDNEGNVVFAVFPDGAKVYVNEDNPKGPIGGFAVSGRNNTKGEYEVMRVTPDSTRIFVNQQAKGPIGGFAVSGRNNTKQSKGEFEVMRVTPDGTIIYVNDTSMQKGPIGGFAVSGRNNTKGDYDVMRVTPDSTRIYINQENKGPIGGFAVSGRNNTKSTGTVRKFMDLTKENYFIGHESGSSISSGLFNSFIGYQAGKNNTTGYRNIFLGYNSGISNTIGFDNVLIGYKAGYSSNSGQKNVFLGTLSGYSSLGNYNIFIGDSAGYHSTNNQNIFIGSSTGKNNSTGNNNTFVGNQCGYANNGGIYNVFYGRFAGKENINGNYNTYIGPNSGDAVTSGDENTYLGFYAGYGNTFGNNNTFLGTGAGWGSNGSNNVFLGYLAGKDFTGSDKLFIENSSTTNPLIYGEFDNDILSFNAKVGIGRMSETNQLEVEGEASKTTAGSWLANSDKRIKTDIKDIKDAIKILNKLRPVKFKYTDEYLEKHPGIKNHYYYNFIAQEYQQVFPESVKKSGEFLSSGEEILQLDAYNANIITVKAVQKLIKENKDLKNELKSLKNRIHEIEKLIQ